MNQTLIACAIVLSTCVEVACAADLPANITAARETASRLEQSQSAYYTGSLQPYFYERVMAQCLPQPNDTAGFDLVFVLDAEGSVSRVYGEAISPVQKCIERALLASRFPVPPVAPFIAEFDIRFGR